MARNPAVTIVEPAPADSPHKDERIVYLGPDQNGVMLEVMAVQTREALVTIHAMPIRDRYRPYLEAENQEEDVESEGEDDAQP